MEPLDTEQEYVVYRSDPKNRFNWLYILPALGGLWLLFLLLAAILQWPIGSVISPVMGLMLLVFFATVFLLFWALAPRENR